MQALEALGINIYVEEYRDGEYNEHGERKLKSGLVVPKNEKIERDIQEFKGVVIAVGPDVTDFKKGDVIYYNCNSSQEMVIGGKKVFIMYDSEPHGRLKKVDSEKDLTEQMFLLNEEEEWAKKKLK